MFMLNKLFESESESESDLYSVITDSDSVNHMLCSVANL